MTTNSMVPVVVTMVGGSEVITLPAGRTRRLPKRRLPKVVELGGCSIERGPYGIDHGVAWGVWRDGELQYTAKTLKQAKRVAAQMSGA